jgi:hypothetical protein
MYKKNRIKHTTHLNFKEQYSLYKYSNILYHKHILLIITKGVEIFDIKL